MLNIESFEWEQLGSTDLLKAGHQLGEPALLFEKIEDEVIQKQLDKLEAMKKGKTSEGGESHATQVCDSTSSPSGRSGEVPPIKDTVSFEDFEKLDIRVGLVKDCHKVKKSKKLLQFTIDDGSGTDRTICSGIAAFYENPEKLIGKRILFVANFAPRTMMGIESQGMILSAVDADESLSVVTTTKDVKPGSQVG
jgi:methionyl-tRNA synthetase